jgi:hypothetical protein
MTRSSGLKRLRKKSRGPGWTVFFSKTVQDSTFGRGVKWIFVDFRMPGVSATCCGVNLADPCTGGALLFSAFAFAFAFSVSCKGRGFYRRPAYAGPLREGPGSFGRRTSSRSGSAMCLR